MFKKTSLIVGFCSIISVSAAFAGSDGSGCGLGKVLLEGKSGTGANVGASIINGIYSNQLFGMSSGTSGCDTTTMVKNDVEERETFIASNIDNLSVDVARGQGNYLASLAHIMKINDQDKSLFYSLTQNQYENIFVSTKNSEEVLAALDLAIASDSSLSKYLR